MASGSASSIGTAAAEELAGAILNLLGTEPQLYPAQIVRRLRASHPDQPAPAINDLLERLFARRDVARLWHRYCLPGDVPRIRAAWLATIAQQEPHLRCGPADPHACVRVRQRIQQWDGWRLPDA